jgi:hypothetical protein
MEARQIGWTISLEYICEIARTWLWDEDKPYEQCEKLLLGMMDGNELTRDEKKEIAIQILEGRKIIRGINEGSLEDDGKLIRPLYKLVDKYRERSEAFELQNHIDSHPWLYVDTFCGGFSIANGKYARGCRDYNRSRMIEWRKYGQRGNFNDTFEECNDPLQAGTLLLSQEWFAKKVLGKPADSEKEVMEKLTIYYNERLKELKIKGIDYIDMNKYQMRIYERNLYACKEYDMIFPYNKPYEKSDLTNEGIDYKIVNRKRNIEMEQRMEELTNIRIAEMLEKEKGPRSNEKGWYTQIPECDRRTPEFKGEYFDMYGWVDTDGTWYSCGFGGHGVKASLIIRSSFKKEYELYVKKMGIGRQIQDSFLSSIGWVKFHNPHLHEEPYVSMEGNRNPTFVQRDRIMDIQKQFNLGIYNNTPQDEGYW